MKIGIVGSTCNPPHKQHIAIGECARQELGLDRLILLSVKSPPHKDAIRVSLETRTLMAKLAVAGRRGWEVSDIDQNRKGKSHTRNLILDIKKKYPKDEIFWIIGSDVLLSMPWKPGGYEILDLCRFVVAPRKGFPAVKAKKRILKKVVILKNLEKKISSTSIRKEIFTAGVVKQHISASVSQFIRANNLYAPEQTIL